MGVTLKTLILQVGQIWTPPLVLLQVMVLTWRVMETVNVSEVVKEGSHLEPY